MEKRREVVESEPITRHGKELLDEWTPSKLSDLLGGGPEFVLAKSRILGDDTGDVGVLLDVGRHFESSLRFGLEDDEVSTSWSFGWEGVCVARVYLPRSLVWVWMEDGRKLERKGGLICFFEMPPDHNELNFFLASSGRNQ